MCASFSFGGYGKGGQRMLVKVLIIRIVSLYRLSNKYYYPAGEAPASPVAKHSLLEIFDLLDSLYCTTESVSDP